MSGPGSKAAKDAPERSFAVRDVVLGKIRGYPNWPAMVVDPDEVPAAVTADRPTGKKYYCVRFFPAGDFAWLTARDIFPLPMNDIDKFLAQPKGVKRSGDLLNGYKIAKDPKEWESTINERIAKQLAQGDHDDEDGDGDEDGESSKKKRRRSDGGNGSTQAKKKRRTSKKNGLSSEVVESEDDGANPGDISTLSIAPAPAPAGVPTKKKEKEDEDEKFAHLKDDKAAAHIKSLRHALQKMFLGKTTPSEKDVEQADLHFKELESTEIPFEYLGYSKIGKVMRHIVSLEDSQIPREAEFKFKARAGDLVAKWHKVANNPPAATPVRNGA